jgi:hypothetical protein
LDFRGFPCRPISCRMSLWVVRLGTQSADSRCSANSRLALLLTILARPVSTHVAHSNSNGEFAMTLPYGRYSLSGEVQLFVPALQTIHIDLVIDPSGSIRVTPTESRLLLSMGSIGISGSADSLGFLRQICGIGRHSQCDQRSATTRGRRSQAALP